MLPAEPTVLQLGVVIEAPTLLGTFLIGAGALLIIYWHLERNVLATYVLPDAPMTRHLLTFPFVVCVFLAIGAFSIFIGRLWFLALILFILGRIIEAAVAVRFFRKLTHYITVGLGNLGLVEVESSDRTKREQASEFISSRLWKVGMRLLIALLALVLASAVLVYTLRSFGEPFSDALLLAWGVYMGIAIGSLLIVRVRKSLLSMETVAILGIIICVTGAELFRFPDSSFTPAQYVPGVSKDLFVQLSGLLPHVSAWDVALVVLGQIAFMIGVILSLYFWSISARRSLF